MSLVTGRFIRADSHRGFSATQVGRTMICEICQKDKVILVTRMKMSDEEEARDVYICDECLAKKKKKGR